MTEIFPFTTIDNVFDENTKQSLKDILCQINHINIGEVTSKDAAYVSIPFDYRKIGFQVTYIINNTICTDVCKCTKDNIDIYNEFINPNNWYNLITLPL